MQASRAPGDARTQGAPKVGAARRVIVATAPPSVAWRATALPPTQQLQNRLAVRLGDRVSLPEPALLLAGLLLQLVSLARRPAQQLPARRQLEALLRARVCLLLWHQS